MTEKLRKVAEMLQRFNAAELHRATEIPQRLSLTHGRQVRHRKEGPATVVVTIDHNDFLIVLPTLFIVSVAVTEDGVGKPLPLLLIRPRRHLLAVDGHV